MKLGPYFYHLNTFNIPNNEGVHEWAGGGATKKPLENEIKRISTLTSSKTLTSKTLTSFQKMLKRWRFFHCHP